MSLQALIEIFRDIESRQADEDEAVLLYRKDILKLCEAAESLYKDVTLLEKSKDFGLAAQIIINKADSICGGENGKG